MAGYIGSQTPVVSNGSQRKYTFTATAAQTVFTGMDIPNPQQIQVFQNGVRLVITTDYTVSSGTTVTLVNAASAGDSLVVILFADYQLLDQDLSGDFSVDSPTFVVDSANNRIGIGTTNTGTYGGKLNIIDGAVGGETTLVVANNNANQFIRMGINADVAQIAYDNADSLAFGIATDSTTSGLTTEHMRIDSSGNLLVGTTNASLGTGGIQLNASGRIGAAASSLSPMVLNRQTSDGTIIDLRKDGTTVGSISANSGDLVLGTTDVGIKFNDNLSAIYPYHSTGTGSQDALIDLGYSTARYKDLYLSGGVYLGGTGAANHLYDYEVGTFTPTSTTNAGTAATFGTATGQYTKIGNVVNFNIDLLNIDTTGTTSTSQVRIDGLPFTVDVDSTRNSVLWDSINFQGGRTSCVATVNAAEYIQLNALGTNIGDTTVDYGDLSSGTTDVYISGFYYTNQ